ncbi:unnamed protein product, partial [Rangifer tarandus platyrhynchus]
QVQPPAGPVSPPALACRLALSSLKTLRAPPASRTPRASCLAPCSQLSLPRTPLPGWRRSSAKGRPAALAGNRTRVNCLEGSYAHHYTTNAAQPGPPPDPGPGLAPAHSRCCRRRRRIPAPTPRQREALRCRRRHPQPTSKPIRASSTQRPGSTGPTAPGRRSCGLAVPRPSAPRGGPRAPPPSPPGGNAGHAATSSQLAKALLHRALGEATSHDDRGTREPPACRRPGAACPWPLAPLPEADPPGSSSAVATAAAIAGPRWRPPQPTPRPLPPPALSDPTCSRPPTAGEPAQAQEHHAATRGSSRSPSGGRGRGLGGLRRAVVVAARGRAPPGPKAEAGDEGPLGARRRDREPPRPPKRLCCLPVGESNPGLPHPRLGPIYPPPSPCRAGPSLTRPALPCTLSLLPAPPPHPCPDAPSAGGSALPPAPPAAHQQAHPRQLYAAAGVHRPHRPGAALLRPCGPPA